MTTVGERPSTARAHELVAAFAASDRPGAWQLDRVEVATRLRELIDVPWLLRQGGLNLCGPAAVCALWLRYDPAAAVTFAIELFERGAARLGSMDVTASAALRRVAYPAATWRCPQADRMMLGAMRDSANRCLRYATPGGLREATAGITLPGAVRRWLVATGLFASVRDETNLLRRKGPDHATKLAVTARDCAAMLIAQPMLRPAHRVRDLYGLRTPDHWILLRAPITVDGGWVDLRYWSWGAQRSARVPLERFCRGYFGAIICSSPPPATDAAK